MEIIKRSEQNVDNTWNLELIYKTIDDYNSEITDVKKLISDLEKYQGHILDNADNLLKVLELDTNISRILEKLSNYVIRHYDEDISNPVYQELNGQFDNLYNDYLSVSSYIVPELLKNDYSFINKYIINNKSLKRYELLLNRIFRYKEHTLSEKEEKIISELSNSLDATDRIAGIIRNSEMQFGKIINEDKEEQQLTSENFILFLKSNDRRVRKDAFNTMYDSYSKYKDTLAECISGMISGTSKINKLKGYRSSKDASLFHSRVDESIYNNLVNTVNNRLDVLYKYFDLKKDELKLDDFHIYDSYVNLSSSNKHTYSFDDAKKIVLDVVSVFGSDYVERINKAFNNRWIDIYPNASKRGGAYSSGSYDTAPYILLNYQNTYNDVSTLIHELGHSMHSMYSIENNDYLYYSYKIFVAEVASTVNELLFNFYMLEHTSDRETKKFIISEMMDDFKATLFRQTMFAEFESRIYSEYENGTILTSEFLNRKYLELNKRYYGNGVVVDDNIKYEWMRIPHFYYNFYVYQYATGISSACYIVNRIRNNESNAVDDYLKFLKSGDSLDPVDELKLAGVDIESPNVINSAIDMFDKLIDEYKLLSDEK